MKTPKVAVGPITPFALSQELTQVVARAANCEGAWAQHPGPLTYDELEVVSREILVLLARLRGAADAA